MSKKQNGRKIRLEYHYDRLSNRKIAQVYKILVPNANPEKEAEVVREVYRLFTEENMSIVGIAWHKKLSLATGHEGTKDVFLIKPFV